MQKAANPVQNTAAYCRLKNAPLVLSFTLKITDASNERPFNDELRLRNVPQRRRAEWHSSMMNEWDWWPLQAPQR
jgi:hypothetical protein